MQRFMVWDRVEAKENGATDLPYNEWISGVYDTSTTPPTLLGTDGGEPEDQTLGRDWSWVVEALNRTADEAARILVELLEDPNLTNEEREVCKRLTKHLL